LCFFDDEGEEEGMKILEEKEEEGKRRGP